MALGILLTITVDISISIFFKLTKSGIIEKFYDSYINSELMKWRTINVIFVCICMYIVYVHRCSYFVLTCACRYVCTYLYVNTRGGLRLTQDVFHIAV